MKFHEAIIKFSSWQSFAKRETTRASYKVHLMHFALYMRNCDIETIKLDDILGYLEGMREIGWDQNSFMVKCVAFRKFFDHYNKQKITNIDQELIPIVEREYRMPKVANLDDYNKILNCIPVNSDPRHIRNKAILMLFKDTGMRLGELISLNVKDMDLVKMQAVIKTEKTKKLHPIRKVFWTKPTNDQLGVWLKKRSTLELVDHEAVFISATGLKRGVRITKSGLTEVMRRLSIEAKLGYTLNSHSLRHLFGHDLGRKKVNNSTISSMLGHSKVESSYVYTMLNEDEMSNVYRDLRKE